MAKRRGNCYVASEALFHLLGGKEAGWKPCRVKINGDTHWFLKHQSGLHLDVTKAQFGRNVDLSRHYKNARGSGFLTKSPSRRARALMNTLTWQ